MIDTIQRILLSYPLPRPSTFFKMAIAIIVLFCITLALSPFYPVYIDDTLYPLFNYRAGYDGWKSTSPFPQCGDSFITEFPYALLPGRTLAWVIHALTTNFYIMRLIAVAILLSWIAYTTWFVKLCIMPRQSVLFIVTSIICCTSFGTLIYPLVSNRAEMGMIVSITFYLSLPFFVSKYPSAPRSIIFVTGLIFALTTSWFISVHPKATFYAPLIFVSAAYLCKWSKYNSILLGLTLLICYYSWEYWNLKFACPDSSEQAAQWSGAAIPPHLLFDNPTKFLHRSIQNILLSIRYVWKITIGNDYWLPFARYTPLRYISNILIIIIIIFLLKWVIKSIGIMLRNAYVSHRWNHPALPISLCLLAAFVGQCILQSDKSFYGTSLIWITLVYAAL